MASETIVHSKMGIIDATGTVRQFCPRSSGADVSIDKSEYSDTDNLEDFCNRLSDVAFDKQFYGIDDSATASEDRTYSVTKINQLLATLRNKSSELDTAYNNGCSQISQKITLLGVATNTTSPSVILANANQAKTNHYNTGYNEGIQAACIGTADVTKVREGKIFTSSVGYKKTGQVPTIPKFNRVLGINDIINYSNSILKGGSTVSVRSMQKDRHSLIVPGGNIDGTYTLKIICPAGSSGSVVPGDQATPAGAGRIDTIVGCCIVSAQFALLNDSKRYQPPSSGPITPNPVSAYSRIKIEQCVITGSDSSRYTIYIKIDGKNTASMAPFDLVIDTYFYYSEVY